jgi:hypothetical protein
MGIMHMVNTCEIPLLLRRITKDDPEIARAREHLARQRAEYFVLEVLSALTDPGEEVAA